MENKNVGCDLMNLLKDLRHDKDFEELNLVVHIPKDSNLVYEYKDGYFQVVDDLDFGPGYPTKSPGEYGYLPRTHYDNGEFLDCLTLSNEGTMPGIVRKVRPIGMISLTKGEVVDEKIIAVQVGERFKNVNDISDLEEENRKAKYSKWKKAIDK
ncbi:MAG: inorganic diphosphatase, partial [Candidatus Aenigmatarchaeota archaeon]